MSKRRLDPRLHIGGVLDPDSTNADGLGHGYKIRIFEIRSEVKKAGRFLLKLDKAERAIIENDDHHRQAELRQAEKIAHQHRETTITR